MLLFPQLEERTALPGYFIPLYHLVVILAISCPPSKLRTFLPLAILLALNCQLASYTAGAALTDYSIGTAVGQITIRFVDFALLSKPETDFWLTIPGNKSTEIQPKESLKEKPWLEKLEWSLRLMTTSRGIGWSWLVKNVPPAVPANYPIRKFTLKHLARAVYFFIVTDVCESLMITSLASDGESLVLKKSSPVLPRALPWIYAVQMYATMNMTYSLGALAMTLLGWPCSDWPPLFGSFRDAYTLRRFWGSTWHQTFRRTVTTFGRLVSYDLFCFPSGSLGSKYIQLYVGFLASALPHCFGALLFARRECGEIRFFVGQAVAITFEDTIIASAKTLGFGEKQCTRVPILILGYVWVICWLNYSLSGWVGCLARAGPLAGRSLPFSFVGRLFAES